MFTFKTLAIPTEVASEDERAPGLTCADACDPQLGKCVGVAGGREEECVALTLIQYHSCMDTCIPAKMAATIQDCDTSCKKSKRQEVRDNWQLFGKKMTK